MRDGAGSRSLEEAPDAKPDASPARPGVYAPSFVAIPRPFSRQCAQTGRRMRRPARPHVGREPAETPRKTLWRRLIGRYIAGREIRRPGRGVPGGVATHPRIIGKVLPAAPGRSAGRCRSYEPSGRVCRRDADRGIPRRDGPRRSRPQSNQLFSTQYRVAGRPLRSGPGRAPGSSARNGEAHAYRCHPPRGNPGSGRQRHTT